MPTSAVPTSQFCLPQATRSRAQVGGHSLQPGSRQPLSPTRWGLAATLYLHQPAPESTTHRPCQTRGACAHTCAHTCTHRLRLPATAQLWATGGPDLWEASAGGAPVGWGQESRGVPTPRLPPPPTSGPRPSLSEAEPEAHLEPRCTRQTPSHRTSLGDWQGPWGQLPRFLGGPRSTSSPPRPSSRSYPRDPGSPRWLQPQPPRLGPGTPAPQPASCSHSNAPPGVPWVPDVPQLTGQSGTRGKLRPRGHGAEIPGRWHHRPLHARGGSHAVLGGEAGGPQRALPHGPAPPLGPATRPLLGHRGN